jgi:hypothetical protein
MMKGTEMTGKSFVRLFLLLITVIVFALPVYADQAESLKSTDTTTDKTKEKSKDLNLSDVKFSVGGDLRLRQEIWTNTVYLGARNADGSPKQYDRNFFRLRVSLWGKADIGENFDIYARLTSEPKYYWGLYHPPMTGQSHGQYTDQDEIIGDNIYISGKKLFNGLVDFRVGRQDFMSPDDIYGEGFLLMDGTPGDGSRTFYFNAAKLRLNITKNNSIDFVYIDDPEIDRFLPSLHPAMTGNGLYKDNLKLLTASHEQGFMVYGRNKFDKIATFDPYYIYKIEDGFGTNPRLKLHTFGGRATVTYDGWRAKGELAYQFGKYDSNTSFPHGIDRTGLGGYFFFGRKFDEVPGKPEIDIGGVYYSGDDPKDPSDKRKAFDPLFSRFPSWNELFIYTIIPETAVKYSNGIPGYWTNTMIGMINGKVNITQTTRLALSYQYLMAAQKTAGLTSIMFSNNSRDRGHLGTAILTQQIIKNLTGMLQFEYFIPGEFYASNTKNASFFRWQLQYKF